jgi:DNA-binding transcriptional ArsR family regulator
MEKKEYVYLYMAMRFEKGIREFSQLEISKKLGLSLSTVHNALKPLKKIHAVDIMRRGFKLVDIKKFLIYWAILRDVERDIVYKTFVGESVEDIESSLPSGVIYTAYSGYKIRFGEVPADYGEVYVYANNDEKKEIEKRFPTRRGPFNLFVLEMPKLLETWKEEIVLIGLLFADVWNLPAWYGKEFVRVIEHKLGWSE